MFEIVTCVAFLLDRTMCEYCNAECMHMEHFKEFHKNCTTLMSFTFIVYNDTADKWDLKDVVVAVLS